MQKIFLKFFLVKIFVQFRLQVYGICIEFLQMYVFQMKIMCTIKIKTIHRWGNNSNNQRVLISTIFKSTNIDVPMVWSVINYRWSYFLHANSQYFFIDAHTKFALLCKKKGKKYINKKITGCMFRKWIMSI